MKETNLNLEVRPSDYKGFVMDSFCKENPSFSEDNLAQMGITISKRLIEDAKYMDFVKKFIADSGTVNGDFSVTTPVQFAQLWMSDVINALYRGRTADKIFGSKNVGTWELEEIVWTCLALTGKPNVYDDFSKANLASYNLTQVKRDTIRFEMGIEVTELEQKRAAQMRQNAHNLKKNAVDLGFDILMNHTKWFGYNDGAKNIKGVLTSDITSTTVEAWDGNTTTATIITDLQTMINDMVTKLQGNYDPNADRAVLVLPISQFQYLATPNAYNLTPAKWLKENYGKVEVKVAPELDAAEKRMFYVPEVATIGSSIDLLDTSKIRLVGAVPTTKGFEESYSCSTAGAFVRCPMACAIYAW